MTAGENIRFNNLGGTGGIIYAPGSGIFTFPIEGFYMVNLYSVNSADGINFIINGTPNIFNGFGDPVNRFTPITTILQMFAGATLEFQFTNSTNIYAAGRTLSIIKVGDL